MRREITMPDEANSQNPFDGSPALTRRALLKAMASASFLIAFNLPARGEGPVGESKSDAHANSFLMISADNTVTAILAQTEGGQGNSTGMTQVIASELGADWALMRFRFTSERRTEYINPVLYSGLVLTAGSSSIPGFYERLRAAAATMREMLVAAAAKQWKVPFEECTVAESFVSHQMSNRRLSFGALSARALKENVPPNPRLRRKDELVYVGKPLARLDVPSKCNGTARYGLDAEVPGMLYAAVRHGPAYGSVVKSIDDKKAKAMPGVRLVMAVPQGVAVVADQYWQAVKALAEVRETYLPHPNARASSTSLQALLKLGLDSPGVPTPGTHGDSKKAMKLAVKLLDAEFSLPILSHVCIEPVSCTALVEADRCEIWLSTKSSTLDAGFAAKALGIDPAKVIVHNEYQGGDFGRRSGHDHTSEAVLLAKAAGRPVKVVWTRKEDIRIDQHRTSVLARVRMGLGTDGMPVAYEAKIAADGVWRSLFPWWYEEKKPLDLPLLSLVGSSYGIPHESGEYSLVPHPIRIGAFRGNNETHNGFLIESMIDEAAHLGAHDPLAYRLKLLAKDARSVAVLKRAASLAGWDNPSPGRFQGVAFYQSKMYRCRLATIVEVSVSGDSIKVERVFSVCDSGLVINPNLARQCLEGGAVFGLSNAIHEQITLSGGAPEQSNFNDYRLLRMSETPDVVAEVISFGEEPGSFGEIGVIPVGAALGNAIFKANGKRIRSQPFAANGVKFL